MYFLCNQGILDLLIVETLNGNTQIRALQNQFDADACFIKVVGKN